MNQETKQLPVPHLNPEQVQVLMNYANDQLPTKAAIVGNAMLNEVPKLPAADKKLEMLKEAYDARKNALGEKEATLSMIGLFTQLALGMYGVANGVDTSGIKFDKISWDNEFKRLEKDFDKDFELALRSREAIKDRLSQKYRLYNEEQQRAEQDIREFSKVEQTKFDDALRAYNAEQSDERAAGRGAKKTPEMASGQVVYDNLMDECKRKNYTINVNRKVAEALSGAAQEKGAKRKDIIYTKLGQEEGQALIDKMSEGWFNSPKEVLLGESDKLRNSATEEEQTIKPLKNKLNVIKQLVKFNAAGDDALEAYNEYATTFSAAKKDNPELTPQAHLTAFIKAKAK
jgi:hypothetical protein